MLLPPLHPHVSFDLSFTPTPFSIQGKYKSLRKSYKGMEKDYRSKLVSMQKEIDDAGAVQHKLSA